MTEILSSCTGCGKSLPVQQIDGNRRCEACKESEMSDETTTDAPKRTRSLGRLRWHMKAGVQEGSVADLWRDMGADQPDFATEAEARLWLAERASDGFTADTCKLVRDVATVQFRRTVKLVDVQ